jgi:hypothetical protein
MEIVTSYGAKLTKNIIIENSPEGIFRVSPQTKKSKVIEFFDDIYTYPPRFNVKWDSIDELHNDLFMSYNYRTLEHSLPFMDLLTTFSQKNEIEGSNHSTNAYIEGYVNKIVSTKFYGKQTKQLQESLRAVPIYVILNGQGNIVLANSTDQLATNTKDLKSLLYNFCGNFDTLSEKNSQLGLFFLSKDDAELYLQEIAQSDIEGTKMFGLSIHCFGLDFAYRVMRDYHPEIDFRIIPELAEVQKLLTKGTGKSDVMFEDGQQQLRSRLRPVNLVPILGKLGKWSSPFYSFFEKSEYFKGTPIYIVRVNDTPKNFFIQRYYNFTNLVEAFYSRITQSGDVLLGFGNNWLVQGSLKNQKQSNTTETYVFFEQDTALDFCKKSKQKLEQYDGSRSSSFAPLIRKPKILIYNLEDFLERWEETLLKNQTNLVTNGSNQDLQLVFDSKNLHFVTTKGSIANLTEYYQQPKKSGFQNFKQFLTFKTRCLSGFLTSILNTN